MCNIVARFKCAVRYSRILLYIIITIFDGVPALSAVRRVSDPVKRKRVVYTSQPNNTRWYYIIFDYSVYALGSLANNYETCARSIIILSIYLY